MRLLYHTDIVPTVTMAFQFHSDTPSEIAGLFDSLATHRIENLKLNETKESEVLSPVMQVGHTIQAYIAERPDQFTELHDITTAGYKPEDLSIENVKKLILDMCSRGRFVPFILAISKEDIDQADQMNIISILAGFGKDSGFNFIQITIHVPTMIKELNMESTADSGHLVYPVVFDLASGMIGSVLTKEAMVIHSFVQKTQDMENAVEMEDIDGDSDQHHEN